MKRLYAISMYRLFGIMPRGKASEYIRKFMQAQEQKENKKRKLLSRSIYMASKIQ